MKVAKDYQQRGTETSPSSGATNSHQTVVDGSPVPKTDSTSLSKENLRSRVYALMRDVGEGGTGSTLTLVEDSRTESHEFRELNSALMESLNPLSSSLTLSKGS
jgi:hypothetical protein